MRVTDGRRPPLLCRASGPETAIALGGDASAAKRAERAAHQGAACARLPHHGLRGGSSNEAAVIVDPLQQLRNGQIVAPLQRPVAAQGFRILQHT